MEQRGARRGTQENHTGETCGQHAEGSVSGRGTPRRAAEGGPGGGAAIQRGSAGAVYLYRDRFEVMTELRAPYRSAALRFPLIGGGCAWPGSASSDPGSLV